MTNPRHTRRPERGAALLLVLMVVAIVTVLATELAYDTRVSLQIAANARDELRASYQARGAVALSRLVLHFQARLDQAGGAASQFVAGASAAVGGQATSPVPQGSFSFRLWDAIPIDSTAMGLLLGSGGTGAGKGAPPGAKAGPPGAGTALAPRGPSDESFQAIIDDEDRKVNVSQLAGLSTVSGAQLQRFLLAVRDPQYDVLFDQEDELGNRLSRRDVAVALRDWVDEDPTTSVVGINPGSPFENGFGDENQYYDRGDDRYRAKNARFDSLDELYLVAGIGDAFMAAFGDHLTVYPDVNAPTNINTSDPEQVLVNALLMSDPPGVPQPPLIDPAFTQKLDLALRLARPLPFMTITVQQFATVLQALGIRVQPIFLQAQNTDTRSPFGNTSSTFNIRATGRAGNVEKTIEAVVTMDARAGKLQADLGRLLHWRED
jgi:general secretion pathway protein K